MCRCSKSIVLEGCQANRPVSTRKRLILYLEGVCTLSMLFSERAGMWARVSFMVQCSVKFCSYELASTTESLNSALGPPTDVSPQESKSKWDVWDAYLHFFPPNVLLNTGAGTPKSMWIFGNANMLWAFLFILHSVYLCIYSYREVCASNHNPLTRELCLRCRHNCNLQVCSFYFSRDPDQ